MRRIIGPSERHHGGYTIVELLFATTIFSFVLLTFAAGFIQISRLYYRSVITSRTQDVARSVIDDVSRSIQFNPGVISWGGDPLEPEAFCIGGVRYSVQLGEPITDAGDWALVRDSGASTDCTQLVDPSAGVELLGQNMRVHQLLVEQVGSSRAYNISVKIIYGDDDLIEDSDPDNPACRGLRIGGQFCAVSELETTVTRRL